ncbi:MAG: hypothetical protein ACP5IA_13850, partial [Sediminispirochaetaceae bacterium]
MKKNLFTCALILICLVVTGTAAQEALPDQTFGRTGDGGALISSISSQVALTNGWEITYGNDPRLADSFDAGAWQGVEMPIVPDLDMPAEERFFWIRTSFSLSEELRGEHLYFMAGRMKGALEFYLNGTLVFTHGVYPPGFHYKEGVGKQFLLPEELLSFGPPNTMAIRIYSNQADIMIRPPRIGPYRDYRFDRTLLTFFNMDIHMILSIVCAFIGFYFLFQYL